MLFFQNYCAFSFLFPLISVFIASFHASVCLTNRNMLPGLPISTSAPLFRHFSRFYTGIAPFAEIFLYILMCFAHFFNVMF